MSICLKRSIWKFFSSSFDGCSTYCVGQARAVVRPALVVPEQRINPAQARQPLPGLEVVAAARERCVDKIEQVEEIEYDEVVSLVKFRRRKCFNLMLRQD